METLDFTYADYQAAFFTDRMLVRAFRKWNAWAAFYQAQPALVLDEYERQRVTLCVYSSFDERAADIQMLRSLPDEPPPSSSRAGGGTLPPLPSAPAFAPFPLPPRKRS